MMPIPPIRRSVGEGPIIPPIPPTPPGDMIEGAGAEPRAHSATSAGLLFWNRGKLSLAMIEKTSSWHRSNVVAVTRPPGATAALASICRSDFRLTMRVAVGAMYVS